MKWVNNKVNNQNKFSFEPVSLSIIIKEITDIKILINHQPTKGSISPKILKISSEANAANILQKHLNESLETGTFPGSLKLANMTPVFKKKGPLGKTNYRPISVLSNLS